MNYVILIYFRHKKTQSHFCNRVFDLRAWQFPTFTWQTATLSSALRAFTSEFGMGSGGSRLLCSPSKLVFAEMILQENGKSVTSRCIVKIAYNTKGKTDWVLYGQASRAISTC